MSNKKYRKASGAVKAADSPMNFNRIKAPTEKTIGRFLRTIVDCETGEKVFASTTQLAYEELRRLDLLARMNRFGDDTLLPEGPDYLMLDGDGKEADYGDNRYVPNLTLSRLAA